MRIKDPINEEQQSRLLSLIRSWVSDSAESEDVLQDVMERYLETYELETSIENVWGWLIKVASNNVIDRFRHRKVERSFAAQAQHEAPFSAAEADLQDRPDQEWIRTGIRNKIAEALDLLPGEQREVFIWNELEGKTFEEIAAVTGDSINTLLSRKRYAIQFLRKYLKEVYDELGL